MSSQAKQSQWRAPTALPRQMRLGSQETQSQSLRSLFQAKETVGARTDKENKETC